VVECRSDFVSVQVFPLPPALPADAPLSLDVGASIAGDIRWNGQLGFATYEVALTDTLVVREAPTATVDLKIRFGFGGRCASKGLCCTRPTCFRPMAMAKTIGLNW
jgi:hypothetical protein